MITELELALKGVDKVILQQNVTVGKASDCGRTITLKMNNTEARDLAVRILMELIPESELIGVKEKLKRLSDHANN